jgi:hypothetical protein
MPYLELGNDGHRTESGAMQKYGIVGGMNSALSEPPELIVAIAKGVLLGDICRADTHFFFDANGYRGVNRRAIGIG